MGCVAKGAMINRKSILVHGYNPDLHIRQSIRLKAYDYSKAGTYFVTIVTQDRLCLFGDVIEDEMHVNGAGAIILEAWEELPKRFPTIGLDAVLLQSS